MPCMRTGVNVMALAPITGVRLNRPTVAPAIENEPALLSVLYVAKVYVDPSEIPRAAEGEVAVGRERKGVGRNRVARSGRRQIEGDSAASQGEGRSARQSQGADSAGGEGEAAAAGDGNPRRSQSAGTAAPLKINVPPLIAVEPV